MSTYWTTQQVPNSIVSFKCFLASFLDRHATGSRLRLSQTLSTLPSRSAADNQPDLIWLTLQQRVTLKGNIEELLHLGKHSYSSMQSFLLPLLCSHREASLILQCRVSSRRNIFSTRRQMCIYSILPRSRISDVTVPLSFLLGSQQLPSVYLYIPCLALRQLCWPSKPEPMASKGWIFPEQ